MKKLNQVLSVVISAAIAATAAPWQVYALETGAMPEFVKTFTPPTRLGYVVNSFKGNSKQPVILIQDLHANFGVQSKIVSLLKVFQRTAVPSGRMILGAEGDSGPIDVSYLHKQSPAVRNLASTALLKEAEIGAPMHFAINSDNDVNLVGIEKMEDYKLHLSLVRTSVKARLKLAEKIQDARAQFSIVKAKMAPATLNKIWKAEDQYINGEIDLDRLARALHLPSINSYEEVEQLVLDRKIELARESKQNAVFLENLVRADHYLSLLGRLFRQQMTLEEVQFTARHMDEALAMIMSVLPNEDWSEWKETIRTAVDYYAIALMRDKPLSENAINLAEQNPDQPVFIVAGGFHTGGMEKQLMARNISFVSIAPVVESHTMSDEILYLNRILGVRANEAAIKTDIQQKPWNNFVVEQHTKTGETPSTLSEKAVRDAKEKLGETPIEPVEGDGKDPIPTPFDVKNVQDPTVAGISPEIQTSILDSLKGAFDSAYGFVGGLGVVQKALTNNRRSGDISIEFGNTDSGTGQEWILNVVQRGNKTVVVVNPKLATVMQSVRQQAINHGASQAQADQRVQQALLSLALSETGVLATGARNERTAMAARLGLFGMMGDAAVQAMEDLGAVLGADSMPSHFAKGISKFMDQAEKGEAKFSTATRIANEIIDTAANLYGQNKMFKAAIESKPVQALFNGNLAKQAGIAAKDLSLKIQTSVSQTLGQIGVTSEQRSLTQAQVDAIYHTNA